MWPLSINFEHIYLDLHNFWKQTTLNHTIETCSCPLLNSNTCTGRKYFSSKIRIASQQSKNFFLGSFLSNFRHILFISAVLNSSHMVFGKHEFDPHLWLCLYHGFRCSSLTASFKNMFNPSPQWFHFTCPKKAFATSGLVGCERWCMSRSAFSILSLAHRHFAPLLKHHLVRLQNRRAISCIHPAKKPSIPYSSLHSWQIWSSMVFLWIVENMHQNNFLSYWWSKILNPFFSNTTNQKW